MSLQQIRQKLDAYLSAMEIFEQTSLMTWKARRCIYRLLLVFDNLGMFSGIGAAPLVVSKINILQVTKLSTSRVHSPNKGQMNLYGNIQGSQSMICYNSAARMN